MLFSDPKTFHLAKIIPIKLVFEIGITLYIIIDYFLKLAVQAEVIWPHTSELECPYMCCRKRSSFIQPVQMISGI